jgi:mannose-6-phosphate isomerase
MTDGIGIAKIFEILPSIKNYSWGLKGKTSWVAAFSIDNQGPYAEAWFGAHPSGPAIAIDDSKEIPLDRLLSLHRDTLMSQADIRAFDGQMPFLPKILSISQPLSIQLHPDAVEAQRLHAQDPNLFPDPYPKDEASVAITKVSLLHSLQSIDKVRDYCREHPELHEAVSYSPSVKHSWRFLENLLRQDKEFISQLCKRLYSRLENKADEELDEEEEWILRCKQFYPEGDAGIFCFFLFHLVNLAPGEAISLNTGVPHAYLSGELFEIMKPSDNVLRCGLTPKHIDVEELLKCLNKKESIPSLVLAEQEQGMNNYNFGKQGLSISTQKGPASIDYDTEGRLHIAISLDASGTLAHKGGSTRHSIEAGKAYLIGSINNPLALEITSGTLALFSFKGD